VPGRRAHAAARRDPGRLDQLGLDALLAQHLDEELCEGPLVARRVHGSQPDRAREELLRGAGEVPGWVGIAAPLEGPEGLRRRGR
jgi:hypothetical protein